MKRLDRLAAAQAKLGELIERRLAKHELMSCSLRKTVDELSESISGLNAHLLPFRARALTRLADAEAMLASRLSEGEAIRRELAVARGREDAFSKMASQLHAEAERKALEEESLETAMRLPAKASGKTGMLK